MSASDIRLKPSPHFAALMRATNSEYIVTTTHSDGFVLTRVVDAPVARVWRAWTEGEQLAKWSAPPGYTIPQAEGDLRLGGEWRCCMRDPDGREHWLGGVYREIVPHKLLSMTHAWD